MPSKSTTITSATLDVSVFDAVIETGSVSDRCQLAAELSHFIVDNETADSERRAVIPCLVKLASDPNPEVRAILAEALASVPDLHPDVVFTIVASEDDYALPFLAATPALDSWRMVAILRVGDQARQITIARRADVGDDAIDEISRKCDAEVVCALLDNRLADLTHDNCRTIYAKLGREPAIMERLINRADLPVDIRIMQARQASRRILRLVTDRGWLNPGDADEVIGDAADSTVLDLIAATDEGDLTDAIGFMAGKNLLTPALVLRAACLGDMHVVEQALAHLAGVSLKRAEGMMYGGRLGGGRALLKRAGLPASCHVVLHAAISVERELRDEEADSDAEDFGRRLIAAMMIETHALPDRERAKQLDYVGRFADERVRILARRVKADLSRAA